MSRLRHFTQGVAFSWLATIATVVYSLLSVPIALRFLTVSEFGLLMLVQQAAAYFTLVDFGMTAATARLLIDQKDRPDDPRYGSLVLAGAIVCLLQAFAILVGGWISAPFIIAAFGIETTHAPVAIGLLRWLALAFSIGAALRIFSSILYANRRIDLVVLLMSLVPLLGLVLMWVVLSSGFGLPGMAWAFVVPALVAGAGAGAAVFLLGLWPERGAWRQPSKAQFREMFVLGKDMFLINVGNQILEASQLMIVTRTMGLGAAAIWSVSSKLFTLVYQLVTKVEGTAIVFFSEMMVRGERERLALRFRHVYQMTAGMAVVALAAAAAINTPFVSVWASPDLAWAMPLSLLLGVSTYLNCLAKCQSDLIMHSKNIRGLRYIYFIESLVFVLVSLWASAHIGFYGVLIPAIVCAVVFRGIYLFKRTAAYFQTPARIYAWSWLRRSLTAAILLAPFVISSPSISSWTTNPWLALGLASLWIFIPGAAMLALVAFPRELRSEMAGHLNRILPCAWRISSVPPGN